MVGRSDAQKVILFAVLFAAVLTGMHVAFQATFPAPRLLELLGPAAYFLNFAGEPLSWRIAALYYPDTNTAAWWGWLIVFTFVSSFVQGAAYGWLGMVSRRLWSTSRFRAVAYPLATAAIVWASFGAGVERFHRVNCAGGDGGGDCDLGFTEGMVWAAVAFAGSLIFVAVVEALIQKRQKVLPQA